MKQKRYTKLVSRLLMTMIVFFSLLAASTYTGFWKDTIVCADDPGPVDQAIQLAPTIITPGGNSITVKGTWVLWDPNISSYQPIQRTYIEVKDSEAGSDEVVAKGYTENDGSFCFTGINNDDGTWQGGRDIYVEIRAENWVADIRNNPTWYAGDQTYKCNNKDNRVNDADDHTIINFGLLTPSKYSGAWNILNTVLIGWHYATTQLGESPDKVNIYFIDDPEYTPGRSYYYGGSTDDPLNIRGIHIQDYYVEDGILYEDQWNKTTILHEYGHRIMDKYADFWPPLSAVHHKWKRAADFHPVQTAWVDGWAHYFSAAARQWAGFPDTEYRDKPAIENNYYEDNSEAQVAGILWDIHDDENEPNDNFELGSAVIWDVLRNYDPHPGKGGWVGDKWLEHPELYMQWTWLHAGWYVDGNTGTWPIDEDHPWDIFQFYDGLCSKYPDYINAFWHIYKLHGKTIPDSSNPTNPTSYDALCNLIKFPPKPTMYVIWSGAFDAESGIEGYSFLWDTIPDTIPSELYNPINYTTNSFTTSPNLTRGIDYYLHVRAQDGVGNWAEGASHFGPFQLEFLSLLEGQIQIELGHAYATSMSSFFASADTVIKIVPYWPYWGNFTPISWLRVYNPDILFNNTNYTLLTGPISLAGLGLLAGSPYILTFYSTDSLNTSGVEVNRTVIIDSTPPATELVGMNLCCYMQNTRSIGFSAFDSGSGGDRLYYRIWNNGVWTSEVGVDLCCYIPPFMLQGEGTHYIEYYAVDNVGNVEITQNQTLYVDDTPPATLKKVGIPDTPEYIYGDQWVTSSTPFNLTATDNIPGAGVNGIKYRIWYNGAWTSWLDYSGNFTLSGEGIHYLEYYAVDNAGNAELTNNQTHFVDNTPPEIQINKPITLWPPLHKYRVLSLSTVIVDVLDAYDENISIEDIVITNVSSDEPENGAGDGNTYNDIVILDDQTVQLRTERNEYSNGRVYTINFKVADFLGNTAYGSFKVYVPIGYFSQAVDDGTQSGYIVENIAYPPLIQSTHNPLIQLILKILERFPFTEQVLKTFFG